MTEPIEKLIVVAQLLQVANGYAGEHNSKIITYEEMNKKIDNILILIKKEIEE